MYRCTPTCCSPACRRGSAGGGDHMLGAGHATDGQGKCSWCCPYQLSVPCRNRGVLRTLRSVTAPCALPNNHSQEGHTGASDLLPPTAADALFVSAHSMPLLPVLDLHAPLVIATPCKPFSPNLPVLAAQCHCAAASQCRDAWLHHGCAVAAVGEPHGRSSCLPFLPVLQPADCTQLIMRPDG